MNSRWRSRSPRRAHPNVALAAVTALVVLVLLALFQHEPHRNVHRENAPTVGGTHG